VVSTARRFLAAFACVAVVLSGLVGLGAASAAPTAGIPALSLNRAYTTAPFAGTTTTANSQEGSAYVPANNALWLVDTTHAYEVDASTDALRRTIPTADFTNALPVGGVGAPAGTTRSDSFAAVAYDPTTDALYVFSRNCCTATGLDPSVFRLVRDGSGAFQVESYQSLPAGTDPKGAGYRAGSGLFIGKGAKINPYNYDTNTVGAAITIPGIDAAIGGMTFSPDGNDLYLTTFVAAVSPNPASIKLYRINAATWTVVPNWTLDLTPFGVLDPRAVEVVGDQIYVSDGGTRTAGDPLRRAIFVFDVLDLSVQPTAGFSATPVTGEFPLPVQFTDASQGGPTSWAWDFGDGTTSTLANPTHTYANAGSYSVSLTVSNTKGSDTSTQTDLVTVKDHSPLAGFTATNTSGQAPLSVGFADTSSNHPTSWAWDFGDGATSSAQNPSHDYTTAGSYAVSLTVTNATGSNTRVRSDLVHVSTPPNTITAAADTYVRSDSSNSNFGTQTTIQGRHGGPTTWQPYVRFTVPALPATPSGAKLRLFVTDASTTTGTLFATANTAWSETTTTYNNRPATTGTQLAAAKAATLGQWVEFDVSSLVTAAGSYSFTLTNAGSDTVAFSSREGTNPPQLVLTYPSATPASGLPNPPHVGLRLNHLFSTSPFAGTTTAAGGQGGSAYVAADNALWLVDGTKVYETDATNNALRRVIPTADFTNALPVGGVGTPAGSTRSDSIAALTYDPTGDVIYAFSRNCCTATGLDPSVFRLVRDGAGKFQVESYQSLPAGTDPIAAGVRPGAGLFFGKGQTILPYDYATNTIGTGIVIPGVDTAISGMAFTPDGKDLLVTSHLNVLYRVSTATWTVVPGWSFDLTPYGFVDPRGVALVGDQLFVSDGGLRPVGDPLRYAVFVFDLVDGTAAPLAAFTASPVAGVAPLATTFIDRSSGVPTSWVWNFGDGSTSTEARPVHTYSFAGLYTVTLTVTNAQGTATTTQPDLVNVAVNPPLLNAKFTSTATSGAAPLPVQFTDASVGGVTGWTWDFGDGTTSTEQNPLHTYTANGKYTVKLTVTSPTGTNTRIRTDDVTVSVLPTTVAPVADSYVRSNAATSNFGTATTIQGSSAGNGRNAVNFQPYLRFSVGALPATPTSAKLRLFVTDASATSGNLFRTSTTWTETGLTWNNKPATTGASIGASRAATLGQWVEFDVSSTVTGAGQYGFTLTNLAADAVAYSSREGTNLPELVLTYGSAPTGPLPMPASPGLALSRSFTSVPFSGTSPAIRAFDLEGSAYVPSDNALWLSDDNGDRVFEVDATTSTLRRALQRSEFSNALPPGGVGNPAGPSRSDDFESIAYDATNDTLYQFSGNCCSSTPGTSQPPYDPTIYRLKRDAAGRFQVESYQALPEGTDPTGSGWRPGVGLFFAHGGIINSYDYNTNTLGTPVTVGGTMPGGITGMTYSPDGKYIIAVTTTQRLILVDATTFTLVPGWNIDLRPFGILDSRAVEFIDGQLFVSDGYDFRAAGDPLMYAVFVFDIVNGPPNATFTATPTTGAAPLAVQFADTTFGSVTSRLWNFGDGSPTSTAVNPSHIYNTIGSYTASLTVTNANGSNATTQVINVASASVMVNPVADSYVRSNSANANFGTTLSLQAFRQFTTTYQPFVRFSIGALPATPVSAKLRLYVTDSSASTGNLFQTANATWTETGITWNNKPATTGAQLGLGMSAPQNQWVEFDVTPVVTGPGEYSFTLTGANSDLLQFSSREGANKPQLVVNFG
jgi:FOG: PKD repeat